MGTSAWENVKQAPLQELQLGRQEKDPKLFSTYHLQMHLSLSTYTKKYVYRYRHIYIYVYM